MSALHSDIMSALFSVYHSSKILKPFIRILHAGKESVQCADITNEGIPRCGYVHLYSAAVFALLRAL